MKKHILNVIAYFGMIGVIVGGIYWLGGFVKDTQNGTLAPEEKVLILKSIDAIPTQLENYKRQQELDSIDRKNANNAEHAMKSRAMRDTTFKKALHLGKLNADQIYQTRKDIDTILKLLKK